MQLVLNDFVSMRFVMEHAIIFVILTVNYSLVSLLLQNPILEMHVLALERASRGGEGGEGSNICFFTRSRY